MRLPHLNILLAFLIWSTCASAQQVPVINVDYLEARLSNGEDTTFVVNFWATWCGSCVKELPYFEALQYQNTKVLLVTLDFTEHMESKVIPFINGKGLKNEVLLLDEGNPNEWIPRISEQWTGAIPATLFVNTKKKTRHFHEGSFKEGDLEQVLKKLGL